MDGAEAVLTTEGGGDALLHRSREYLTAPLPTTLAALEEHITLLVDEISLIQVQLSEAGEAWCTRTGRTLLEHATWRRRALIAKAYKERQLRECKRRRRDAQAVRPSEHGQGAGLLMVRARAVVAAWDEELVGPQASALGRAVASLATCIGEIESGVAAPVNVQMMQPGWKKG